MISKMPGPTRPRYLAAARPTDQLRVNSASGHHYSPGVARRDLLLLSCGLGGSPFFEEANIKKYLII